MFGSLIASLQQTFGGRKADALNAQHRKGSVDAAVAWWVESLRGRDGVDNASADSFGLALGKDLATRLDTTYRVYLEVGHQAKGILREIAQGAGLSVDAFPQGTTMTITDRKVEVSKAALEPYQVLHTA